MSDKGEKAEALARIMRPDAWAEYDAENGSPSNAAGWACIETLEYAARLIKAGIEPPQAM